MSIDFSTSSVASLRRPSDDQQQPRERARVLSGNRSISHNLPRSPRPDTPNQTQQRDRPTNLAQKVQSDQLFKSRSPEPRNDELRLPRTNQRDRSRSPEPRNTEFQLTRAVHHSEQGRRSRSPEPRNNELRLPRAALTDQGSRSRSPEPRNNELRLPRAALTDQVSRSRSPKQDYRPTEQRNTSTKPDLVSDRTTTDRIDGGRIKDQVGRDNTRHERPRHKNQKESIARSRPRPPPRVRHLSDGMSVILQDDYEPPAQMASNKVKRAKSEYRKQRRHDSPEEFPTRLVVIPSKRVRPRHGQTYMQILNSGMYPAQNSLS